MGIQFGYVRSHEDILTRIGESIISGTHIIQTKDGNRLLEISNNAVWASITISYQIKIDNFLSDSDMESASNVENILKENQKKKEEEEVKEREKEMKKKKEEEDKEYQKKLTILTENLNEKQNTLTLLLQKEDSLKQRLRSVTGPLLLLRETFKTGIYLRDKLCTELDHWNHLYQALKENEEVIFNLQYNCSENNSLHEHSPQSLWLQDLEYIQKLYVENSQNEDIHPLKLTHILDFNITKPISPKYSLERFPIASEQIVEQVPEQPQIQEIELEQEFEEEKHEEKVAEEKDVEKEVENHQEITPQNLSNLSQNKKIQERIIVSSSKLKITPKQKYYVKS